MSTLTEMRTLVRQLLDDENDDSEENRWADTEIDFALEAALENMLFRVGETSSRFDQTTEVTTSSGTASLASVSPLLIKSVEYKYGTVFVPLSAADGNTPTVANNDGTLRVTYVEKPAFPGSGASEVSYGAGAAVQLKMVDRLVAIRAALDLLPKEGETNAGLERQEAKAWEALSVIGDVPRSAELVSVGGAFIEETTYYSGVAASYRWSYVPGTETLRLVF